MRGGTAAPGAVEALSVTELVARVKGAVEGALGRVCVTGEITGFRRTRPGHCYFAMKDAGAQIAVVLFRSQAERVRFDPKDGIAAIAWGRVTVYADRGQLQVILDRLEPHGIGALHRRFEELRARLAAEGLFAEERKRALPFLPRGIGLVTSGEGAALHDMLVTLRSRFPSVRVVLRPVRVQGIGASAEIAKGLREIQSVPGLDEIIVGRGGGSLEDLWAFNEEEVARAIAASSLPVVSAVGHEIDVTIADLVADVRAPTPTAAAERVVPKRTDLLGLLETREKDLVSGIGRALAGARSRIEALRERLRDPRRDLVAARRRARELEDRLVRGLGHRIEVSRTRVVGLVSSLSGLSPLAVLERGFAVVWKEGESRVVRSAGAIRKGDRILLRLADGSARAEVLEPLRESLVPGRS